MTGLVRKATLLTFAGLLLAGAAFAGVPSPANSTRPTCISYVGIKTGTADPVGAFTVTVRDLANNPINASNVVVDFSGCPDTHSGNTASQQASLNLTVDGLNKTVKSISNASGIASFDIVGGGTLTRTPFAGANCAKIYADGVLLGRGTVRAVDEGGLGGVQLADLALSASDFFNAPTYYGRSDYDCLGGVQLADLSLWASDFFSTNSAASASAYAW